MTKGSRLQPLARVVLRTQSDERLVALSREGRERAFEEIVRRYRPGLVAFAGAYTSATGAEDVVQESLVSSWSALQNSSEEIALKPWLYTIVRNRALNARRDAKPHERLDENIDGVRQPSEIVLASDELARVVAAVNALPDAQREALVRSAIEGHTHEQIAEALETSPGAVRQLIYRARGTVRYGFGALVPMPLVSALVGGGSGAPVVAATAGTIGTVGAGSILAKGAAVVAVSAVAVGGGIALERSSDAGGHREVAARDRTGADDSQDSQVSAAPTSANREGSGGSGSSGSSGSGGDDSRSSDSGPGGGSQSGEGDDGDDQAEEQSEQEAENARETAEEAEEAADEAAEEAAEASGGSGPSGSGSSGSGTSGSDSPGSDTSGSGSSGSGTSGFDSPGSGTGGSGSSGSGSSGSESPEPEPVAD